MEFIADVLYDLPKDYGLVFDVIHYIVCLQGERLDLGDQFATTTQNHPLASWLSSLLVCFAGGFLVNPLCGEPVLEVLADPWRLAIFTLLWYLLFYSPGDHVYTLSKLKPVKAFLYVLKGLYYPKKIVAGIKHAKHVFHGNWIGTDRLLLLLAKLMFEFYVPQPTALLPPSKPTDPDSSNLWPD